MQQWQPLQLLFEAERKKMEKKAKSKSWEAANQKKLAPSRHTREAVHAETDN